MDAARVIPHTTLPWPIIISRSVLGGGQRPQAEGAGTGVAWPCVVAPGMAIGSPEQADAMYHAVWEAMPELLRSWVGHTVH